MQAATKEIRCLDIWPLFKLSRIMIRTYRNLDRLGTIAIQYPIRITQGKACFEYMAAVPQEWARDNIKRGAEQIRQGLERQKSDLETQLLELMDGGTVGQILEVQDKYLKILKILEV